MFAAAAAHAVPPFVDMVQHERHISTTSVMTGLNKSHSENPSLSFLQHTLQRLDLRLVDLFLPKLDLLDGFSCLTPASIQPSF